jgi:hypothetical protein
LAITALTIKEWSILAARYNILLLLITFATYVQRDLWPLATFTQQPQDGTEGQILWFKVGALFATAVLIPLFVPRRYIPVDPKVHMLDFFFALDIYALCSGPHAGDQRRTDLLLIFTCFIYIP